MLFKRTSIALAVAAFAASPLAFATDEGYSSSMDVTQTYNKDTDIELNNSVDVSVEKDLYFEKDVYIYASVSVRPDGAAHAFIDNKQKSHDQSVFRYNSDNNAYVGDYALEDAFGVIGVNVAAGDNNAQDNALAIAVDNGACFLSQDCNGDPNGGSSGKMAHAEVFADQMNAGNTTVRIGSNDYATLGGSALAYASGVIGVNVAAGANNLQKNNLAVAVADNSILSQAQVEAFQESSFNQSYYCGYCGSNNYATVGDYALGSASGVIGVNVAAGSNNLQANHASVALTR